jgi:5-formyltetrahydrofolate cyclo-ligase
MKAMLKTEIRKEFKNKRRALSAEERMNQSKRIAETVASKFDLSNKVVSIFLPIERLNEVDTTFLIDLLGEAGSDVCTPISDFNSLELRHVIYNEHTILEKNDWGIPEPVNGEEIYSEALDLVFVPLLITNKDGYRVGYGKGFYDRFLSQCRKETVFIGLNYFEEFVQIEDVNSDDVPIHFVVTPNKVIKF